MKFKHEPLERKHDGYYQHSQLPYFDGAEIITEKTIAAWEADMEFKLVVIEMEHELEHSHPAYQHYFVDGEYEFDKWNPAPPTPEAVLLLIHCTEDGPVAWWAVEQDKETA